MTTRERTGLTLLAGGAGLSVVNIVTWALGRGAGAVRPTLSAALLAAGLLLLAIEVMRGMRDDSEG